MSHDARQLRPEPQLGFSLRLIRNHDDTRMAAIIRQVMNECGAGGPGFAVHDVEVDHMSAAYTVPGTCYWVIEQKKGVMGGAGVAALVGGPDNTCELRKMYFLPQARGKGAGHALLLRCLESARELGYAKCYIETLTGMDAAMALYLAHGFAPVAQALGRTGHFGCNRFLIRDL